MEAETALREAFHEREMRVERTVNRLRAGLGLALTASDLIGLVGEHLLTRQLALRVGALVAVLIGYVIAVGRLSSPARYRPWLKYVTISVDFALIASIFLVYDDMGARFGMSREAFLGLLAPTVMLFVVLGALRRGAAVVAYATALGSALFLFDGIRMEAPPLLVVYGALMIVLAGLIAWAVSSGITAIFVRLRRRDSLSRFLPKIVLDQIDAGRLALAPGGQLQTVTVLFADIRGFTSLSEKLTPDEVVQLLNEYLACMTSVVFANHGTIDKFVGDAIMAVFGAPSPSPDDAARALRTAAAMLEALTDLNARWRSEGRPELSIGIGLHTGKVVAGIIGSPERMEYTVIGDTVNVASRLEGMNKQYGTRLLMSEATCRAAGALEDARFIAEAPVRGRREPIRLYTADRAAAAAIDSSALKRSQA